MIKMKEDLKKVMNFINSGIPNLLTSGIMALPAIIDSSASTFLDSGISYSAVGITNLSLGTYNFFHRNSRERKEDLSTEVRDEFEDMDIKRNIYSPENGLEQNLDEFMRDDESVKKRVGRETRKYEPKHDKPMKYLEYYGFSDVTISYLCDDYTQWQGSQIIRASVVDGAQAQRLIESCLNNYSKMSKTSIKRETPFENIPFETLESIDGRKTLNLVTGANHPEIGWREMYNIFVDELNEI